MFLILQSPGHCRVLWCFYPEPVMLMSWCSAAADQRCHVRQVREGVRFADPNGLPRIAWAYIKLLGAEAKQQLGAMRELLTAAASEVAQLNHEVSSCPAGKRQSRGRDVGDR